MPSFMPIVLAFGPGNLSYYISNGRDSSWHNIPAELLMLLETDHNFTVDQVTALQLFPEGGYFVRTRTRTVSANIPGPINERIIASGDAECITDIEHDAASPTTYVCSLDSRAVGVWPTLQASLPSGLIDTLLGNMNRKLDWCRLGYDGEWVCMMDQHLYSDTSVALLQDALKHKDDVYNVILDPYERGQFFIDYQDGTTAFEVKEDWRADIDRIANQRIPLKPFIPVVTTSHGPERDIKRRSLMIPRLIQRRASAEGQISTTVNQTSPSSRQSSFGFNPNQSISLKHMKSQPSLSSYSLKRVGSSASLAPLGTAYKPHVVPPCSDERTLTTKIPILPQKVHIPVSSRSPTSSVTQGPAVLLPNKHSPISPRADAMKFPSLSPRSIHFSGKPRVCPPGISKIGRPPAGNAEPFSGVEENITPESDPTHDGDVFSDPEADASEEISKLKLQEVNFIQQYSLK